jgi:DNA invertase Pin-like site-specific DNA recombinase
VRIAGRAVRRRKEADIRVPRGDAQLEDQEYAVYKRAAEMERELIRERTREALMRLKAQGKHVGRPPKWSEAMRRKIIDLVRRGLTLKEACQLVGIGYRTAQRYLSKDPEYLKARMEARLSAW